MRRWLAIGVLCLLLLITGSATAQSDLVFSDFVVNLWPEYDRSDLLVIYRMTLAPDVSLPAQVSLRIPLAAGTPYNVAFQEVDGQLYNITYTTDVQGEWVVVTFTTPSSSFQLEYYDPGLKREADQRSFTYVWPGDYDVQALLVSVMQPVNASDMRIEPNIGASVVGSNGLSFYEKEVGEVERGTSFNFEVSYSKADEVLTNAGLQPVEASAPIGTQTAGGTGLPSYLPIVFAAAGAVLLIGGIFWMFYRREQDRVPASRPRHRSRPAAEEDSDPDRVIYCHQCGKRASTGDVFCRVCGTKLRH